MDSRQHLQLLADYQAAVKACGAAANALEIAANAGRQALASYDAARYAVILAKQKLDEVSAPAAAGAA